MSRRIKDKLVNENIVVNKPESIIVPKEELPINNNIDHNIVKPSVPSNFIEIKLDSCGKLSAPYSLHFRNYTMNEVIKLSNCREIDLPKKIIECLNAMCWEDFDCGNLVEQDIMSILLVLYGTWIKDTVEMSYYINLDVPYDQMNEKENIAKIELSLKDHIKTAPIPSWFNEPISMTIDNVTVKFKLPRFKDFVIVNEFIKEKYFIQERKFSDIENKLKDQNSEIDYNEFKMYQDYIEEKENLFLDLMSLQTVYQYNDIILDTSEKKLEYSKFISLDFWDKMTDFVTKDFKFGIIKDITFKSPLFDEPIIRRFNFRLEEFLPKNDFKRNKDITLNFG